MSTAPQIKIGNKYYPVDNLMDKDLFSTRQVSVYSSPEGAFQYNVAAGARVGKIYSYIVRNGNFWWQLYENNYYAFVKHEPGAFSVPALSAQGVLDTITQREQDENADLSIWERFWNEIKPVANFAKIAIPLGLAAYLGVRIWGEYQKSQSYKKQLKK
jgi:hypothetical protein